MIIKITPDDASLILRFEKIYEWKKGEEVLLSTGAKILIEKNSAYIKGYAHDQRDVLPYFTDLAIDAIVFARGMLKYLRAVKTLPESQIREKVAKMLEKRNYMWIVESPDSFRSLQHKLIGVSKKTSKGRKYSVGSCELLRIIDTFETVRDITPKGWDNNDDGFTDCKGLTAYNKLYNAGKIKECRKREYVPYKD